uniref:mRNA splicing factor U5 snRNP 200 kDa n=2 Tax=Amorphochlora amoebiformis TaxID=1561963 RepID=A0A0H5BIS5_9EUKA|nr:mRNA splicing factor U5 snRNP 200 kDa [Amorphochlora amoebiformis]
MDDDKSIIPNRIMKIKQIVNKIILKNIKHKNINNFIETLMKKDINIIKIRLLADFGFSKIGIINFIIKNRVFLLLVLKLIINPNNKLQELSNISSINKINNQLGLKGLKSTSSVIKNSFNFNIDEDYTLNSNHFIKNINYMPKNSFRIIFDSFEEIHFEYKKNYTMLNSNKKLVQHNDFPNWLKIAFPSVSNLNFIQSQVYPVAIWTNSNIFLCSPTGSGKTIVGMLGILRSLKNNIKFFNEIKIKNVLKVIYLAPLKALIKEIYSKYSRVFRSYRVKITDLTTDNFISIQNIKKFFLIITTPEKLDIMSSKSYNLPLISNLELIIVDEMHLLHYSRGVYIERIVSKFISIFRNINKKIRFIGITATFPNFQDASNLLRASLYEGAFYFDESYRICPIYYELVGLKFDCIAKKSIIYNAIVLNKAVISLKNNYQILIFVHTRNGTVETSNIIIKNKEIYELLNVNNIENKVLTNELSLLNNNILKKLIINNIGIHHSGLRSNERVLIEDLFYCGIIKLLVSTSTLAWGVNLPAHTVLIKGTSIYDPSLSKIREINFIDVLQMIGRAGRPQFDIKGHGILLTSYSTLRYYLTLMNNKIPIESCLIGNISNSLISFMSLKLDLLKHSIVTWLKSSYLFIRINKNFSYYLQPYNNVEKKNHIRSYLNEILNSSIEKLLNCFFLFYSPISSSYTLSGIGLIAGYSGVDFLTIDYLNNNVKTYYTDIDFMEYIGMSLEFNNISIHKKEFTLISKMLSIVPIPIRFSLKDSRLKFSVLIQIYIARFTILDSQLENDINFIVNNTKRILLSTIQLAFWRQISSLFDMSIKFYKMINRRMWNVCNPLIQMIQPNEIENSQYLNSYLKEIRSYTNDYLIILKTLFQNSMLKEKHKKLVRLLPNFDISMNINMLNENTISLKGIVKTLFLWNDAIHNDKEYFWITVRDVNNEYIIFKDLIKISKFDNPTSVSINILLGIEIQYGPYLYFSFVSDKWIKNEFEVLIDINTIISNRNDLRNSLSITNLQNFKQKKDFINILSLDQNYSYKKINETRNLEKILSLKKESLLIITNGINKKTIIDLYVIKSIKNTILGSYIIGLILISASGYLQYNPFLKCKRSFCYSNYKSNKNGLNINIYRSSFDNYTPNTNNITFFTYDNIVSKTSLNKFLSSLSLYQYLIIDLTQDQSIILNSNSEIFCSRFITTKKEYQYNQVVLIDHINNTFDILDWFGISYSNIIVFNKVSVKNMIILFKNCESQMSNCFISQILSTTLLNCDFKNSIHDIFLIVILDQSILFKYIMYLKLILFRKNNYTNTLSHNKTNLHDKKKIIKDKFLFCYGLYKIEYLISFLINKTARIFICSPEICPLIPIKFTSISLIGDNQSNKRFDICHTIYKSFIFVLILITNNIKKKPKIIVYSNRNMKNVLANCLQNLYSLESELIGVIDEVLIREIIHSNHYSKQILLNFINWTLMYRCLLRNPLRYGIERSSFLDISTHFNKSIEIVFLFLLKSNIIFMDSKGKMSKLNFAIICEHYNFKITDCWKTLRQLTKILGLKQLVLILSQNTEINDKMALYYSIIKFQTLNTNRKKWKSFVSSSQEMIFNLTYHFINREISQKNLSNIIYTIIDFIYHKIQFFIDFFRSKHDYSQIYSFILKLQLLTNIRIQTYTTNEKITNQKYSRSGSLCLNASVYKIHSNKIFTYISKLHYCKNINFLSVYKNEIINEANSVNRIIYFFTYFYNRSIINFFDKLLFNSGKKLILWVFFINQSNGNIQICKKINYKSYSMFKIFILSNSKNSLILLFNHYLGYKMLI